MKFLLFIVLTFSIRVCQGQLAYVQIVDSAARVIESGDDWYGFDSVYTEVDKDSNIVKQLCLTFRYRDFKRRSLVMVTESEKQSDDSSLLHYFFRRNELVKIYANIHAGSITTSQQFYFNRGKLVFPNHYRSVFEVSSYVKRAKEYTRFKQKKK